jgi:hypothetical protein
MPAQRESRQHARCVELRNSVSSASMTPSLDPEEPDWPAYEAMSLAAAGRIEEAERALAEAERLGLGGDHMAGTRAEIERAR